MRTLASYDRHIDTTVRKCCSSWIVLCRTTLLGPEYLITPHLCKSNYCETCRPRNLLKIRKALIESLRKDRWRLVTLTFPDHSADVLQTLTALYRQFKKFVQRIRRVYPDVKFIRTIEIHQSGFPHIHMIVSRYIPAGFLSKHWHDVGGGIVDIRVNRTCSSCGKTLPCPDHPAQKKFNYKQAARYLTEELEKKNQDPHNLRHVFWQAQCKSITTSRNLQLKPFTNEWTFSRFATDLYDAMQTYEMLLWAERYDGAAAPSVVYGKNSVQIGYALKDKSDTDH